MLVAEIEHTTACETVTCPTTGAKLDASVLPLSNRYPLSYSTKNNLGLSAIYIWWKLVLLVANRNHPRKRMKLFVHAGSGQRLSLCGFSWIFNTLLLPEMQKFQAPQIELFFCRSWVYQLDGSWEMLAMWGGKISAPFSFIFPKTVEKTTKLHLHRCHMRTWGEVWRAHVSGIEERDWKGAERCGPMISPSVPFQTPKPMKQPPKV